MDVEEDSLSEITDFEERRITMYVGQTQYEVVKEVGRDIFGWKLTNRAKEDWDLCWMDERVTPERLMRMRSYQRINHFPGMHSLSHKNCLAVNLTDMRQLLPSDFSFFPKTWLLPKDYAILKREFKEKRNRTFIVKPEAESQGRGIYLTRDLDRIPLGTKCVVQKYVGKPLLIDGLKFDLRIYVLVASCDPLRIYIHQDGLARFATETYQAPLTSNLSTTCMHLTNYAINKNSSKFVFNYEAQKDDVGHKRSLKAVMKKLEEMGFDAGKLWGEIGGIAVKTLISAQPMLSHISRSCHPSNKSSSLCFEILGLDILIDHNLKPWLLEVNHSPSFTTNTPLDSAVKTRVIADALTIVGVGRESRETHQRLIDERNSQPMNWTTSKAMLSKSFVETKQRKPIVVRKKTDDGNLGGYQKLYPPDTQDDAYQSCLEASLTIWRSRTQPSVHIHKALFQKPVTHQESASLGHRRLSFSNKRPIKVPSASSIGMDQSFMRSIILRRVPKGSFVTPKTLKFGILASRKPGSRARIGLKVVRIRDC